MVLLSIQILRALSASTCETSHDRHRGQMLQPFRHLGRDLDHRHLVGGWVRILYWVRRPVRHPA